MKRIALALIISLALLAGGTLALAAVEAPASCKHCGMNRTKFAHSRMLVTYADGSAGTCSINCVAVELRANKGKAVKALQVGDYDSKRLIDAKTATWVIGGKKQGVMTTVPKWAFADKKGAEKFVKENGGKLATYAEAMQAADKEQDDNGGHKGHGGHKM